MKVLIVDDETTIVDILVDEFEETLNAEVFGAYNGEEGLNIIKSHERIDLVITDFKMPKMNGEELIKAISHAEEISHKPKIILITAYQPFEIEELINNYNVVLVKKPFEFDQLEQVAKDLLGV